MNKNNNFETLKAETSELIKTNTRLNTKNVLNFINKVFSSCGSQLEVHKNMSIAGFESLLVNSPTIEDFKKYIQMLNVNKCYHITSLEGLNEDIEFNEEYNKDDKEEYENEKKFLDSRIQLNENLFIIEYPEN